MQNSNPTSYESGHDPEADPVQPQKGGAKHHIKKLNIFAGKGKYEAVVLIVVFIAIGAGAYFLGTNHGSDKKSIASSKGSSSDSTSLSDQNSQQQTGATTLDGSTYLDAVKQLPDLHFFKTADFLGSYCSNPGGDSCNEVPIKTTDIKYYQIGTAKDGRQIIVFSYPRVGLEPPQGFALGDSKGSYVLLQQMDQLDKTKALLNKGVSFDDSTKLKPVIFPGELTISNQKLKLSFDITELAQESILFSGLDSLRGFEIGGSAQSYKKIGSSGDFTFYEAILTDESDFKVAEIYSVYKMMFSTSYVPNGEIAAASGKLSIKWKSGVNTQSTFYSAGKSCGSSSGYLVAKNVSASQLQAVGTTPKGQTLYQLPTNNSLVQKLYTEDYNGGDNIDNASLKNLSIQEFSSNHGYFLVQNGLGEYVLYENYDLIPGFGGCAKPVIYLYPQQTTKVSVAIGADITKSVPAYGSQGWTGVTASPDGQLSIDGQAYPYLFWEGYGNGRYPVIDQGVIVKASDAASTVKRQLKQQGLTPKETSDFIDYWGSKLTSSGKPYIRLTWLDTSAMNELAPLNISPKPQTIIRVFLDFQGLDRLIEITPQKLTATPRSGFTAVEWGGYMQRS